MNCILVWLLRDLSTGLIRYGLTTGSTGASCSTKKETGCFPQYIHAWLCFVPDPTQHVSAKMSIEKNTNAVLGATKNWRESRPLR